MFDISIGKLALVAVIALIVLGPERLPRAARTAGMLLRKARSSWQNVRDEIEREISAEELKRQLKQATDLDRATHSKVELVSSIGSPASIKNSSDSSSIDERN